MMATLIFNPCYVFSRELAWTGVFHIINVLGYFLLCYIFPVIIFNSLIKNLHKDLGEDPRSSARVNLLMTKNYCGLH